MARKLRVPQHALNAPMRFIPPGDSAWDSERILREYNEIAENGGDIHDHPVYAYRHGRTRFDLDADPRLAEYIDKDKKPEIFHLRRLTLDEAIEIEGLETPLARLAEAFCMGVKHVENSELAEFFRSDPRPSKRDIRRRVWDHSVSELREVGEAVLLGSSDLMEEEKKA